MTCVHSYPVLMPHPVRRATPVDAGTVARLLHDFNTEYDAETPGVEILAVRLTELLATETTRAYLGGEPATGVALITSRANVWYPGAVWLLDELYVVPELRGRGVGGAIVERMLSDASTAGASAIEINVDAPDVDAQRFYEQHGFLGIQPDTGERAYYYARELG